MPRQDPTEFLKRILGEEGEALSHMLRPKGADEALLASHGIDTDAMLARAEMQISRAANLSAQGIHPPIPLEELSEAAFQALDIATLEKYLAAGDVDIQRLLKRTRELLEEAKPKAPKARGGLFAHLAERLPRWQSAPMLGMAVSAMVLVAVGVGVVKVDPKENLVIPKAPEESTLAVTLATTESELKAKATAPLMAAAPVATQELAREMTLDEIDLAAALKAQEPPPALSQAMPEASLMRAVPPADAPAATVETTDIQKEATAQEWAVSSAPAEPAGKQTVEFVFAPGDTFSQGMTRSGVPTSLSLALAERVGSNFQPGDKLIIFFENDEFEQLVVIRRKKEPITVTADLKTQATPAGMTQVIEVTGEVESSLYVALEKALDANTAQRITWLLQSRAVPLTTLPKGTGFSVSIEKITGANGETLGFGEIKSVHLDAGKRGKFAV